ncbi:18529_t:CDS:2 [Gigaspora rosea]|nr:18529_t:CDS:2 [Gigaspora rosea]
MNVNLSKKTKVQTTLNNRVGLDMASSAANGFKSSKGKSQSICEIKEWSRVKKFKLSACMLDKKAYSNSVIDHYDLKLVFGSNFSILKDLAYLFVYSSEHCDEPLINKNGSNSLLQHVELCICTFYVRDDFPERTMFQEKVRWNHMSIKDKIFFSEFDASYNAENKLVFVNQFFDKPNRKHGIFREIAWEDLGVCSFKVLGGTSQG